MTTDNTMTAEQIKQELDALGVEYKAKATKDELLALLAPYQADDDTPAEDEAAPEAEAEADTADDPAADDEDGLELDLVDDLVDDKTLDRMLALYERYGHTTDRNDAEAMERMRELISMDGGIIIGANTPLVNFRKTPGGEIIATVRELVDILSACEEPVEVDGVEWQACTIERGKDVGLFGYVRADLLTA